MRKRFRDRGMANWVIVLCILLTLLILIATLATQPLAVGLAAVGLAITLPAVAWLDNQEPEPWKQKARAFLWGACVATVTAGFLNSFVGGLAGALVAVAVCAPIVEEGLKIYGIRRMVARSEIDSPIDGIVYAAYCALGFAAVENVTYLADTKSQSEMWTVFVARVLLSPFAHPLFTMWAGKRIGEASLGKLPMREAVKKGWIHAALLHAAWNLSASVPVLLFVAMPGFVYLFFWTIRYLKRLKAEEDLMVAQRIPEIARRYDLEEPMLQEVLRGRDRPRQIALRRLAYGSRREKSRNDPYGILANQLRAAFERS